MSRGYSLVLPPGWARIPVRSGTDEALAAVAEGDALQRMRRAAEDLRRNGGLDMYVPVEPVGGFPLPASFVAAEVSFGAVEPLNPALLVSSLSAGGGAAPTTVDGVLGVRKHMTAPPDPARGLPLASRRVDYVLPVPRDPDRWLSAAFSVSVPDGADEETVEILVELFDAIMTTFRWA